MTTIRPRPPPTTGMPARPMPRRSVIWPGSRLAFGSKVTREPLLGVEDGRQRRDGPVTSHPPARTRRACRRIAVDQFVEVVPPSRRKRSISSMRSSPSGSRSSSTIDSRRSTYARVVASPVASESRCDRSCRLSSGRSPSGRSRSEVVAQRPEQRERRARVRAGDVVGDLGEVAERRDRRSARPRAPARRRAPTARAADRAARA